MILSLYLKYFNPKLKCMKQVYIIFLVLCMAFLSSCEKIEGYGPILSEVRNHKNFEGLRVSICGQVNFQVAPEYKVEVLAQANILDELITKVDDGDLVLKWDHPLRVRNCEDVTVNIKGPDLSRILSSGSSDIKVTGEVRERDLELDLSGSGSMAIQEAIITDRIKAHLSGSGEIYIDRGKTDETELYVSGSGEIDFSKIESLENQSHISGSGSILVNVKEFLEAHISGSGDVYYLGDPRIDAKISGSGRVKKR
jgi:hypothetical protein